MTFIRISTAQLAIVLTPFMCRLHPKHFETQDINITIANILCTHLTSTTRHASGMAQDIEIVRKYFVVLFLPNLIAFWGSIPIRACLHFNFFPHACMKVT